MPAGWESWAGYAGVGLVVGIISGMLGIGGGVLVIPGLVFIFGFTQEKAIGTSLAMLLPPIGIFALMQYWPKNVDLRAALLLAGGFAVGGYFGGRLVRQGHISGHTLRLMFAFFMLYVAGNMLFRAEPRVRAALKTAIIIAGYASIYWMSRAIGRRWDRRLAASQIYQQQRQQPLRPDYEI